MRVSRSLLVVGLLVSWTALTGARPSDPIRGPVLGFTPNADGTVLWPILGIPGASLLGPRVALGEAIEGAVISPRQNYALALKRENRQVVLIRLNTGSYDMSTITSPRASRTAFAVSPTGSATALYDGESRMLQTFRGFPDTPELAFEINISSIPGRPIAIAISDDASTALAGFEDGGRDTIWVVNAAGARFVSQNRASSLSFFVNRHDAVVADGLTDEAYLLSELDENPARTPVFSLGDGIEGMSGAAVSDDGRFVVVAGAKSGTVGVLDLHQGGRTILPCNCQPTGVQRLTGTAIFRLNEPGDALVTVIDLSTGSPRILVVPPAPGAMDVSGVDGSR